MEISTFNPTGALRYLSIGLNISSFPSVLQPHRLPLEGVGLEVLAPAS